MADTDLEEAEQAERLGDAAGAGQPAAAKYREAQRLLLPPGLVWTNREAYDRRMEAFNRIQQKLYACRTGLPVGPPEAEPSVSVWDFTPGLVVQIVQPFTDYDGQEIRAGEVLHLLDRSYFPYDSGHTLRFAEKTIRLAGIVDEHEPIIANAGNAWFRPLSQARNSAVE